MSIAAPAAPEAVPLLVLDSCPNECTADLAECVYCFEILPCDHVATDVVLCIAGLAHELCHRYQCNDRECGHDPDVAWYYRQEIL